MNQETPTNKKGRLTLLLIFAVFALPILSSWLMVSGKLGWQPQAYANHGILLQPPINIGAFKNQSDGPEQLQVDYGNWLLAVYIPAECTQACVDRLHELRQVHLTLGRDVNRLTRVLIFHTQPDQHPASVKTAIEDYQEMSVFINNQAAFEQAMQAAAISAKHSELIPFIVDGLGNIILAYTEMHEGKGLQKDLGRLLRASRTQ